jgi:hypothetical protein
MSWLERLEHELHAAGIPRTRRQRIVAELADHIACDPGSEARLGDPAALASRFADEVGTVLARRAAFAAFLCLAPLGVLFVGLFTLVSTADVDVAVTLALVLGVQLAFVGGSLGVLRAWRLRRRPVVAAAEATVLIRRAALGLVGGAITVGGVAGLSGSAPALAWTTVGVGVVSLLAGAVVLVGAARLRPVAGGEAAGLELDLGPLVPPVLGDGGWPIAVAAAGVVALAIALAGAVVGDGIDGLVRGVGDGALCLTGFALLGRPLALRR